MTDNLPSATTAYRSTPSLVPKIGAGLLVLSVFPQVG